MKLCEFKKVLSVTLFFLMAAILLADTNYKVKKGDTLYSISKKYQLTVAELRAANNLSENDVIKVGQNLIIPDADIGTAAALTSTQKPVNTGNNDKSVEYIVSKGDTLYSIAKKNNTTVPELLAINNLDTNAVIIVGQKLKIKDPDYKAPVEKPTEKKSNTETPIPPKAPDTRKYGEVLEYDSNVVWPVSNPVVTQVKGKISGVQLSAKSKEPVICVHEGTVMYVGTYRGFGQVLFVQSKIGLIYAYTGLGSIKVKKGEYVMAGDKVGTAGVDPLTGKPQITFMVFQNGNPIDPAKAPRS